VRLDRGGNKIENQTSKSDNQTSKIENPAYKNPTYKKPTYRPKNEKEDEKVQNKVFVQTKAHV
jgi:hypothetical protein